MRGPARESDTSTRTAPHSRFAWTFGLIATLLFAVYAYPYSPGSWASRFWDSYLAAYARLAGTLLSLAGEPVHVEGRLIAGRFPLTIVRTCDAMETNIVFLAAALAFPASWPRRLVAASTGLLALVALNLVRIGTLYLVGAHAPSWFEPLHVDAWPLLMLAGAAAIYATCVTWMSAA